MEAKHDFILVFDGVPDLTDEVADALYEAGCDDGTFMMRSGLMYGAFHRPGHRMTDAVAGAIRDVRKANIGAAFREGTARHDRRGSQRRRGNGIDQQHDIPRRRVQVHGERHHPGRAHRGASVR